MNIAQGSKERLDIQTILAASRKPTLASLRRNKLLLAGAAVALLALVYAVWSASGNHTSIRYVTEAATRGALVVVVTATGSIQPTNQVEVSSELSGIVRTVLVDYNSPVTVGQTLAELDTDKLKATVDSSRAKLEAARAKLTEAEATVVEKDRDLARKRDLEVKKFTSTQDLDAAQAAYHRAVAVTASMRAEVGVADAQLKLDETNLSKAKIVSPINGVVLTRNVEPGQTVASSLQAPVLFSIAEDLKQMELQVDVDEADVGKVKEGQGATFTVDAYSDRRFPATIRELRFASETIQGVVTYKAVLTIDNAELLLRPGMTATAEIKVMDVADAILVPNAALRFSPPVTEGAESQPSLLRRLLPGPPRFRAPSRPQETGPDRTVWALDDGQPKAVKVAIGASDGKRTEIREGGIEPGQAVIIDSTTAAP
jgi:HlyD family secretion protein